MQAETNCQVKALTKSIRYTILSGVVLLLLACTLPSIDANPSTAALAQRWVATELHRYWQERYAAYQAGQEQTTRFLQSWEVAPTPALPSAVAQAYQFYADAVEAADWGNVYLLQPTVQGRPFYLIYVTTDGDDGWLELYGLDGSFLSAARRYLELVTWDDRQTLRQQTATGEFPAALQHRMADTLWGK